MTRVTLTNVTYRQMFSRYAETDPFKINTNPLIALCGARYGLGAVNELGWVRSDSSQPAAAFMVGFAYAGPVFVEPWVMELDPTELNIMADLMCISDERFREVVAQADRRLTEVRHHASGQTELWEKAVAQAELRVQITEHRYANSGGGMSRDRAQKFLAWMTAIDKLEKVNSQDVFKAKLAEQAEHHEDDLYRLLESKNTSDEIATNHGMTKYKGDPNAPVWKTALWEKK